VTDVVLMTKRRSFSSISAGLLILALAASAERGGSAAADSIAPGVAGCTALGTGAVPGLAAIRTTYEDGSAAQPAHCIVRGSASPHTGVDGKAYETRFELRLPTMWSGRFLYQGGGGNDGIVAPAVGRNTGAFPETGLQRGFAVVTTDAGHQGGTPEFGLDPTARVDHAYAAHERTATLALAIVARYYGRSPDRPVLRRLLRAAGGRGDVRPALSAYFDGIAILSAAMRVSSGATMASAWDTQTYLSIAPSNTEGQRVLSRAFSDADLALVARGIVAACDGDDGRSMGWCSGPTRAASLRGACGAAATRTRPVSPRRRWPRSSGRLEDRGRLRASRSTWGRPGILELPHQAGANGSSAPHRPARPTPPMRRSWPAPSRTSSYAARSVVRHHDVRLRSRSGEDGGVLGRVRHLPRCDAGAFHKRGGKLLIFHGTADPIFSALESIDYYQRLARNNGGAKATSAWARLFLVPGMNHCAGGPPPTASTASARSRGGSNRGRRPNESRRRRCPQSVLSGPDASAVCVPAAARYKGSGSLEDGANFACAVK
jgi:feruloyl esterase